MIRRPSQISILSRCGWPRSVGQPVLPGPSGHDDPDPRRRDIPLLSVLTAATDSLPVLHHIPLEIHLPRMLLCVLRSCAPTLVMVAPESPDVLDVLGVGPELADHVVVRTVGRPRRGDGPPSRTIWPIAVGIELLDDLADAHRLNHRRASLGDSTRPPSCHDSSCGPVTSHREIGSPPTGSGTSQPADPRPRGSPWGCSARDRVDRRGAHRSSSAEQGVGHLAGLLPCRRCSGLIHTRTGQADGLFVLVRIGSNGEQAARLLNQFS